ncbi:MAG TPA: acyl-CoA dehydrogenase family protein [Chloroflexia bacterium]|nr:acyl-CoA dehydrogenase family protein [Chloroflexia bacterium]
MVAQMAARLRGGEWVLRSPTAAEVFTPEDLDDTQKEIARTVASFVEKEVTPAIPQMEEHDFSHNVRLLRQLGAMGFTGIEIPEQFGGQGLGKVTAAVVIEALGAAGAFNVTYGAHTGIGTLPIVFFGNQEQKQRYLPQLATAAKIAAYCLTEASAGSDALGARTTARRSPDGQHWILNGTKQWISNAAFADVFVVYAKVDGEQFTAFIVERDFPGFSTGREEHKMGIRGSSTRSVILEDCLVPAANVLYEVGKGHHIAFNILNIGRFMLGAGTLGGAKRVLGVAARYAQERVQFGQPIARFPLIQQKLAEMAVRLYAAESASYRTAALLEAGCAGIDHTAETAGPQSAQAIREYVVECSIMKVLGSETLDYITDEAVQIHGGYGYMEEFEVCRAYRDSRINRIFEGTNEINRLLVTGDLLKKGLKGELPIMAALGSLPQDLAALTPPRFDGSTPLAQEVGLVEAARKIGLLVAGRGVQKYGLGVDGEEEFLAGVADILIEIYALESAVLRAQKYPSDLRRDLAVAYTHDAFNRIETTARTLLAALAAGDTLRTQLAILGKLVQREPVDTIQLKRRIAQRVLDAGGYALGAPTPAPAARPTEG